MPLLAGVIQAAGSTGDVNINVDGVHANLDLRDLFDLSYPTPINGDTISFFMLNSATLRSVGAGSPSVRTGLWPAGVTVVIDATAAPSWSGAGGAGGDAGSSQTGQQGGTAFLAENAVDFVGAGATLSGGGGGGGGTDNWFGNPPNDSVQYRAAGGGGAGDTPGPAGTGHNPGGNFAQPGTTTTGGAGGNWASDPFQPPEPQPGGGAGGALGTAGVDAGDVLEPGSEDNVGGAAGFSIDGFSLVNVISAATLVGPTNG